MTDEERAVKFWGRVRCASPQDCWEWTGATNNAGYGTVSWGGKTVTAHRLAAHLHGLVGSALAPKSTKTPTFVLHKCDNRRCCNPHHFFLGNYSDNQKDAYSKNRRSQPKSEHVNAKLSASDVQAIRCRYKTERVRQVDLAKEFGVSQRVISLVVRNKTYLDIGAQA